MQFRYFKKPKLPSLAWCAYLESGRNNVDVVHGNGVECFDYFFVSGVWDGNFSDGDFINSHFACCTGCRIEDDCLIFSTPSHPLERLYSIKIENRLYISNSLPLLLVQSGSSLDTEYLQYEEDFCSSLLGVLKDKKITRLSNDRILNLHLCSNLKIDDTLSIKTERKYSRLSFTSFSDYFNKIIKILKEIKSNSIDLQRRIHYGMITTISKGYDAAASSVFARKIGCDKVITFNKPDNFDCGKDIALICGYTNIIEANADLYKFRNSLLEVEACVSGDMGSTITFSAYEKEYVNCLLFMGIRGDSLWERLHLNVNDNYDFSEGNCYAQASTSLSENLLKNNSVLINIPLIGADKWSELARISNSEEMKTFSLGDIYDRPIPRRVLEEHGVPRLSFGQKKMGCGISFHFNTFKSLKRKMSPTSFQSLQVFRKCLRRNNINLFMYFIKYYLNEFPIYLNYIFSKMGIRFKLSTLHCGKMSSPLSSLLILWSMNEMMKRYKEQLK